MSKYNREWHRNHNSKMKRRCELAINSSKVKAKRNGNVPMNATVTELIEAWNDRCYICKSKENGTKFHADHCHATGRFRGWVCKRCNGILGFCGDDPEILRRAIDFLTGNLNPHIM